MQAISRQEGNPRLSQEQSCPQTAPTATLESSRQDQHDSETTAIPLAAGTIPSHERDNILRRAYGSRILAHREFPLQAVTVLSVASVTAKLFTFLIPEPLRYCGLFMLLGWAGVQSLLLLFHSRDLNETGLRACEAKARRFAGVFRGSDVKTTGYLDCLAWPCVWFAVGVPCALLVVKVSMPWDDATLEDPTVLHLVAAWAIHGFGVGYVVLLFWSAWISGAVPEEHEAAVDRHRRLKILAMCFGIMLVLMVDVTVLVSHGPPPSHRSFLRDFGTVADMFFNLCVVVPIATGVLAIGTPPPPFLGLRAAVLTQGSFLLFTAYMLWMWIYTYDEAATSQEDWVKWLG
jgi:hypothetical protein